MWPVSPAWGEAILGSYRPVVQAAATLAGRVTAQPYALDGSGLTDLPMVEVLGGSITQTYTGRRVTAELSMTVADPDHALYGNSLADPLEAFGQRLRISAGVQSGRWSEVIPMGVFRIDSTRADTTRWREYAGHGWTRGGQALEIRGSCLWSVLVDAGIAWTHQPPPLATVRSEILRLCSPHVPVGTWTASRSVSGVTYDHDLDEVVADLAQTVSCVPMMDRLGVLQLVSEAETDPVWDIEVGDLGALLSAPRESTRDGLYNAQIVTGQTEDQQTVWGMAEETYGPLAVTGPYGRVQRTYESQWVKTDAEAAQEARSRLATAIRTRSVLLDLTTLPNLALEVLDSVRLVGPDRTVVGQIERVTHPLGTGVSKLSVRVPWTEVHR